MGDIEAPPADKFTPTFENRRLAAARIGVRPVCEIAAPWWQCGLTNSENCSRAASGEMPTLRASEAENSGTFTPQNDSMLVGAGRVAFAHRTF
jgi:hypothetical protein